MNSAKNEVHGITIKAVLGRVADISIGGIIKGKVYEEIRHDLRHATAVRAWAGSGEVGMASAGTDLQ